jgi:GNAT superfamily N-acetyltransferase
MSKTMNNIWANRQADLEPRQGNQPIDWAKWEPYTVNNGEFLVRPAKNDMKELEKTAFTFRDGFPALRGCEFESLFNPNGFYDFLGKGDDFNKGLNYMLVVEHIESGEIAAALIITMLKKLRRGEHLVIAVQEEFQGNGLGKHILTASDSLFEKSDVEMAFGWCAAYHTATQKILYDLGYTPRAVIPGLYRLWVDGDDYRRSVEVFFQKFFQGAEKMCSAELELLPEIKQELVVQW